MMNDMNPFLRSIEANPGNPLERAVFADWCDENGYDRWEAFGFPFAIRPLDIYSFGFQIRIGRGIGIGSGSGIGIGIGRGIGIGIGRGNGSGSGRGIGSGSGIGIGSGSGSVGIDTHKGALFMEPGQAYIVHCGDWHTIVGRCLRMISPVVYVMTGVSKIADTGGGDNWHLLASNEPGTRALATYLHCKGEIPVPLSIYAIPWEGKTPAEVA